MKVTEPQARTTRFPDDDQVVVSGNDSLRSTRTRHYPETGAGGYSRVDGTVASYSRVQAVLPNTGTVVDLGAGRGSEHLDDVVPFRRRLRDLRGPGRRVLGLDVDAAVLDNRFVDEALQIDASAPLPLEDGSVEAIVSDYVLEHIDDVHAFVSEIGRVLKPGGWLCARTPNLYSYVGVGANLVPNKLHVSLLEKLQPDRKAVDVFPTRYRLNSTAAIRKHFAKETWRNCTYTADAEPVYVGGNSLAWTIVRFAQRVTPPAFRTSLFVFLQKRDLALERGRHGCLR